MSGKLFLVPTPIGNLEDLTFRGLRILKEVDLILAEDTRTSGKLCKHYNIETPMQSFHLHNEHQKTEHFINEIVNGKNLALITDAGTPGISDPGYLLVKSCIENSIVVECLPGATAFVPALVVSGLPSHEFLFVGFLPQKKGRQTKLEKLSKEERTVVMYESPHKILSTLEQIMKIFGAERKVSLSREISKLYEETIRGTAEEVFKQISDKPIKGEIVLLIEGL
ncbi:16S rRNA (cytidine(1402)-2'-O)-methyltransferase [Apibacter muscae]|uniref:16S rRNA (cytidine(1402)-2'-O)-methyltransferase n=1 Tax=Apibacter muscae TaxID=2509004 RepID=UPI0011ABA6B7|nr:16S rRNA (cytidine(1402)-2'-O)-methyltransferase [Apibacter muscae]TWP24860.1 16S rRNA (cytidine(1402)-2'-O)-methyltransferase [Apibacter muscae]